MPRSKVSRQRNKRAAWQETFMQGANSGLLPIEVLEQQQYQEKWMIFIESLALGRFEWTGLPESIDERYLERTLFLYGASVIFDVIPQMLGAGTEPQDESLKGMLINQRVMPTGSWDLYGNWQDVQAIGDDGTQTFLKRGEGILVFDSLTRKNSFGTATLFASELAEIDALARSNRRQQRSLTILKGSKKQEEDIRSLGQSLELATWIQTANESFTDSISLEAIQTGVPYLQDKFAEDRHSKLNELYAWLGVEHVGFEKGERLVTAEAEAGTDAIARVREDRLSARRLAAAKLNEKFNLDVRVDWRTEQKEVIDGGSNSIREEEDYA